MRLKNKVAVITGGASGIGAATVRRFIDEGCRCVIGDLQQDTGTAFAAQFGDAAVFVRCDVTIEGRVADLIDTAVTRFGQLDSVFNNASLTPRKGSDGHIEFWAGPGEVACPSRSERDPLYTLEVGRVLGGYYGSFEGITTPFGKIVKQLVP